MSDKIVLYTVSHVAGMEVRLLERAKLDKKGRLTIPAAYRKKLDLGEEVALILEEDCLIVCKTATAEEFKMASKRLAEEIARTRDKPIGFEKLF